MPYDIRTKDGIVITGIPDDIPKDDQRLKAMVAEMRAAGQKSRAFSGAASPAPVASAPAAPQPTAADPWRDALPGGMAQPSVPDAPGEEPRTDLAGLMGAAVRGAGPIAAGAGIGAVLGAPIGGVGAVPGAIAGAGSMALSQFVGDPLVDVINNLFGTKLTRPTDALNQLFTAIGVPEPDTAAERVVQAASSGAGGAAGSVALGQALSSAAKPLAPSVMKAVGDALAAGSIQQVTGGIGAGGASQTAAEIGAPGWAQLAAGIGGGALGSAAGNYRLGPAPRTTAPLAAADDAGVSILTSDVRPPRTAGGKWLQRRLEEMPFGTGSLRARQMRERSTAVANLLDDYGAKDIAALADDITGDLITTRGATLGKWTKAKLEVIDRLSDAGQPVPMTQTTSAIDDAIAGLQRLGAEEHKPLIAKLQGWKATAQGKSLRDIEDFRDIVRSAKADPSLAAIKGKSGKVADEVYRAVRADMGDYIKQAGQPGDIAKWKDADKALAIMAEELKIPALKSALQRGSGTPEQVYRALLGTDKSTVATLYKNLSPEGRAAARSAILAKAAGEAGQDVSPDKFARNVKKMADQVGVFFSGDDLQRVNGLVRVLDYTKHAGAATASPVTGAQAVLPLGVAGLSTALGHMFGNGVVGFGLGLTAMGGVGMAAKFLESKPVRDILMKLPTVAKGSPEELALLKRLVASSFTLGDVPAKKEK